MSNFLSSNVLPGEPIEKNQHRLMVTVLIVAVIALIVLAIFFWLDLKSPREVTTPTQNGIGQNVPDSPAIQALKQASIVTEEQRKAAISALKEKTNVTEAQREAAIDALRQ